MASTAFAKRGFASLSKPYGAADGARTRDNSDHNRVLYQLSYGRH